MKAFQNLKLLQKFGLVSCMSGLIICLALGTSVYGIKKMSGSFSTFIKRDEAIALGTEGNARPGAAVRAGNKEYSSESIR